MSQSAPHAPSVVVNAQNNRQQVPLRDYLNARVAPFLKQAITESLGAEAEFPLQWLGECLIHQSILYEGNPDRTNIRDHFLYKFENPKPSEQAAQQPPSAPASAPSDVAPPEEPAQQPPETIVNEEPQTSADTSTAPLVPEQPMKSTADVPVTNGVSETAETTAEEAPKDGDTEMGGIS
ncbi:hypothetical protein LTS15_000822 [Exophiala xenobiotica]|nr:hypothetical protein LTS15_000822 [Exophiala xenobiotica]